ncbi:hypothetical protein Tco_1493912 [Tanacetum coccineum]
MAITLSRLQRSVQFRTHKEEHDPRVDDLEEPFHQEFNTGNDDVSPVREAIDIDERLWNPSGSRTPDREWNQTKTLDWHNPEGRPYPHDLSKPLPLILDARDAFVIPRTCGGSTIRQIESYPKEDKPPQTHNNRSDISIKTPYIAYLDIQGNIYPRIHEQKSFDHDELHKFSDGTLNHVRTSLNDIATGIQMEYLPKRKWSKQDKQRARVMIKAIDKNSRQRLIRSLEKLLVKTLQRRLSSTSKDI